MRPARFDRAGRLCTPWSGYEAALGALTTAWAAIAVVDRIALPR